MREAARGEFKKNKKNEISVRRGEEPNFYIYYRKRILEN
jgi:hypothetical protein